MRVIFLGTPDFAVQSLNAITKEHEVVAVITQPDRLGDRGKLAPPPIKLEAIRLGIPYFQFEKIRDNLNEIKAFNADIMVTVAYGQILSNEILDSTPHGVINVHASLLPKYRGSSPIQWAIINGEKITGITIMRTAFAVDSGDILLQQELAIDEEENASELFDRLSSLGALKIIEALRQIENNKAIFVPQDHNLATHFPMLKKVDGFIDFEKPAKEIYNLARGLTPWPMLYCYYDDEMWKLHNVKVCSGSGKCGEIVKADIINGLVIACGEGAITAEVQLAGGKRMTVAEYLRGHSVEVGKILKGKNNGI